MELNIEQALQQGVAAHNEGKLEDAERLYRAILQSQPEHPDANHNLGLIVISANQASAALPLFKIALDAKPRIKQFWLSYIDALIKDNQIKNAKRAIKKAKKKGFSEDELDALVANFYSENKKTNISRASPSQTQLESLLGHYQNGRFGEAEKLAIFFTERFPEHQFGWKVLGALLGQSDRSSEAVNANQKAVTLSPKDAQAHSNLGNTLKELGRLEEAEESYRQAIALKPDYADAYSNLGVTLKELGRLNEAEESYRQAIALKPDYAQAHSNLGNTLKELGRLEEAEESYRQAIALKPDYAEAYSNLGVTLHELGRLNEAEEGYRQAIALKPDYAEAYFNLGVTLKEQGRLGEAEEAYRQAIALKSDSAKAHNNLGITLQEQGRLDEAKSSYRQAITLKPDYAEAHFHLTEMKKFDSQDEQYLKMQELYLDKNISEEQRCYINFSLAKVFEDLEEFDQAFQHYKEGNMLRKKLLNYDINQDIELFKRLKSSYVRIEQNSLKVDELANELMQMPIFIVGMPRSGTTLVEQIISSHSQVTGAGELSFAGQFGASIAIGLQSIDKDALLNFRREYLAKLQDISNDNLIVTDKMPQNFRYIGLLAAAFPEAKIVHVKRDPAAVCWANYKQCFSSKFLGYGYALDDVLSYYRLYENLMAFWEKSLSKRIYHLDYDLLTVNQENETHQLIDYLGLEWDEKCLSPQKNMRSVATASNMQVRKKVYQGSSQQWKKYKPFLNGALDGLRAP